MFIGGPSWGLQSSGSLEQATSLEIMPAMLWASTRPLYLYSKMNKQIYTYIYICICI